MKNESIAQRQRKLLLVLPLVVLPFITLLFWALGGGQGATLAAQPAKTGLKTDLPGIQMAKVPTDKLSYYELASADSIKTNDYRKNDPYFQGTYGLGSTGQAGPYGTSHTGYNSSLNSYSDPNEAMVYQKINALNATLQQNNTSEPNSNDRLSKAYGNAETNTAEVNRLEQLMKMMQDGSAKAEDPEMRNINGMLEKILDIQHPDRVTEKLRSASASRKGQVFSVSAEAPTDQISLLQNKKSTLPVEPGFYSIEHSNTDNSVPQGTIKAVVFGTQVLTSGSELKMKLVDDVFINGVRIPKGNPVTGIASLSGERLTVTVDQIQFADALFPVNLTVFDKTGIEGIRIEGSMSRDVAKQSGTDFLQGINMPVVDPSLGVQAANAGIELTKGLVGKKAKLIKVTVKAGYHILLLDGNQRSGN